MYIHIITIAHNIQPVRSSYTWLEACGIPTYVLAANRSTLLVLMLRGKLGWPVWI